MKNASHSSPVFSSSLDLIGNTPLIELSRIYKGPGRILGKAEFIQPGASVKDRVALEVIQNARKSNLLAPGQPVVEMTSGNTGAGLAVVCNLLGHPFTAVMSAGNSPARVQMLEGFGAKVVLTPQVNGKPNSVTGQDIAAAVEEAKRIAAETNAYYVNQFQNPGCVSAHVHTTGPEIFRDTEGGVTAFVAGAGTGGTFIGTSQYLKSQNKNIFCAVVEPEGADILAGNPVVSPRHLMQGMGYGIPLPHWDPTVVDTFLTVSSEEATLFRKRLAQEEGLYLGFSSAANVCASIKLLESGQLPVAESTHTVVTILCDTGLKY